MSQNLQYTDNGNLRHFLSIDGLRKETLEQILTTAEKFTQFGQREIKKLPLLRGHTVVNLFFENSSRTRTTFEIAAKRLSADVINLHPTHHLPARAKHCWTQSIYSRPCTLTCLSFAMQKAA